MCLPSARLGHSETVSMGKGMGEYGHIWMPLKSAVPSASLHSWKLIS